MKTFGYSMLISIAAIALFSLTSSLLTDDTAARPAAQVPSQCEQVIDMAGEGGEFRSERTTTCGDEVEVEQCVQSGTDVACISTFTSPEIERLCETSDRVRRCEERPAGTQTTTSSS